MLRTVGQLVFLKHERKLCLQEAFKVPIQNDNILEARKTSEVFLQSKNAIPEVGEVAQ